MIRGGGGDDYLSTVGSGTLEGGAGNDFLIHTGTGTATLKGGAGDDKLYGNTVTDVLLGGSGNDVLQGRAKVYQGGAGSNLVLVTLDGQQGDGLVVRGDGLDDEVGDRVAGADSSTSVNKGYGDWLMLSFGSANDNVKVTSAGANALSLVWTTSSATTLDLTGFEALTLDGGAGADSFRLGDLAGAGVKYVNVRFGRLATNNGTKTVETAPGSGQTMIVPDIRYSDDRAADSLTIEGTANRDGFTLVDAVDQGIDSLPALRVTRRQYNATTKAFDVLAYHVDVAQSLRSERDAVTVAGLAGDDVIDASGLTVDRAALTLEGGAGNDRLIGSRFDDVIDGGTGDDRVTGGEGTDVFSDAARQRHAGRDLRPRLLPLRRLVRRRHRAVGGPGHRLRLRSGGAARGDLRERRAHRAARRATPSSSATVTAGLPSASWPTRSPAGPARRSCPARPATTRSSSRPGGPRGLTPRPPRRSPSD